MHLHVNSAQFFYELVKLKTTKKTSTFWQNTTRTFTHTTNQEYQLDVSPWPDILCISG